MVAAHHLIWSLYGWWLPNDPRGSSSHEIRIDVISELGELHHGRKRIQPPSWQLREFFANARDVLKHALLTFSPADFRLVANSFAATISAERYTCYACAIMPDHVHLLIRKHRDKGEQMIGKFQKQSRQALIQAGIRSLTHPVWGGPGWDVFQDTRQDIERTIPYIEKNPMKIWLPAQRWDFVTVYDGWMPGRPPAR